MHVVYVMGYGRSGSTLLDVLLGNSAAIASVGELDLLARDWSSRACSCGERYADCPFWHEVRRRTDETIPSLSDPERERILRRVERISSFPAMLAGLLPRAWSHSYREYVRAELDAIVRVAGKPTILDSSKSAREAAGRALALRRIAGVDVKMIHLVRDGRAVLWSVKRGDNVRLGEGRTGQDAAFALPAVRALLGWLLANAIALATQAASPRSTVLRVRYEDLVRDPTRELARIGRFIGHDLAPVAKRIEIGEPFPSGHSTGGNRLRKSDAIRVREDREWESRLGKPERALYWALGWPLALTFRSRPGAPAAASEPWITPAP